MKDEAPQEGETAVGKQSEKPKKDRSALVSALRANLRRRKERARALSEAPAPSRDRNET